MRIQSVNFASGFDKISKHSSFKGFLGKSKTEVLSFPRWNQSSESPVGTYHTKTVLTYYNFLDDKQEELNRILSENTYVRTIPSNSYAGINVNAIEESSVKVKNVPITLKLYNSYLEKELSSKSIDSVTKTLKKAGLRELVKK